MTLAKQMYTRLGVLHWGLHVLSLCNELEHHVTEATSVHFFLCCSGLLLYNSSTFQGVKYQWQFHQRRKNGPIIWLVVTSHIVMWWVVFQCQSCYGCCLAQSTNFPQGKAVGSCSISKACASWCQHSWISIHPLTWLLQVLLRVVRYSQVQKCSTQSTADCVQSAVIVQWKQHTSLFEILVGHLKVNYTFPCKEMCFAHD
jgi:hypothetical protein